MKYFTTVARRIQGEWVPAGTEVDPSGWRRGALERMLSRGTIAVDTEGGAPGSKKSIEIDEGDLQLVGDEDEPGSDKVYGTDENGEKGWKDGGGVDDPGNVLGGIANEPTTVVVGDAGSDEGGRNRSVVIGIDTSASDGGSVNGDDSVVIGHSAVSSHRRNVVAGSSAASSGTRNVVIGWGASSVGASVYQGRVVIGAEAKADGYFTTSIGASAESGSSGTALGESSKATHSQSVAVGRNSSSTDEDQVAIGPRHVELLDVDTPAQPGETAARLAVRDNDGTQELVIVFGNGTVKVIADDS